MGFSGAANTSLTAVLAVIVALALGMTIACAVCVADRRHGFFVQARAISANGWSRCVVLHMRVRRIDTSVPARATCRRRFYPGFCGRFSGDCRVRETHRSRTSRLRSSPRGTTVRHGPLTQRRCRPPHSRRRQTARRRWCRSARGRRGWGRWRCRARAPVPVNAW